MKHSGVPRCRAWLLLLVAAWAVFAPSVLVALPQAGRPEIPAAAPAGRMHNYLYANADGVNNSDPSGHFSLLETKIGMVIIGTLNGMAINSARNTLSQANDIFSPTGEISDSLATLEQAMFVYEQINNMVVAGLGSVLAKRGLVAAWQALAPKALKAIDRLTKANPTKIFQAQLGRQRQAQTHGIETATRSEPFEEFIDDMPFSNAGSSSAATPLALQPTRVGGLVIGRGGDLDRPFTLAESEFRFSWPQTASVRSEWKINSGLLRQEMRKGIPIRDASPGNEFGMYLNAERNLLSSQGWNYNAATGYWHPPSIN